MTDTERLVEFVLAQIADDEAAARAAASFHYDEPTDAPWERAQVLVERGVAFSAEQHIARHDPARVLADCAAKRAIVEYKPPRARSTFDDGYRRGQLNMHADILRLLAQPYADRPGFDPAWKVET